MFSFFIRNLFSDKYLVAGASHSSIKNLPLNTSLKNSEETSDAQKIASTLFAPALLLTTCMFSSTTVHALSIELDGTRTVLTGTDCGAAPTTYRFGTTASWQGTALDIIVTVNDEDNDYTQGTATVNGPDCVYVNDGVLSVNLRDRDAGDDVAFIDTTITIVAQGTTTPVFVDRITGTGFDLDSNGAVGSTGSDDIYLSGPGAGYLSSNTNVVYSTGSFAGGHDVKFEGSPTSLGDCADSPSTPVITCRSAASWTGGASTNSISSINARFQNDNAYGSSTNDLAHRLLQLSFVDAHAEEILAPNSDFGDAPASYGSASHNSISLSTILGYGLGADHDTTNQPSADALGDDNDSTAGDPFYDDEDAVIRNGTLLDGQSVVQSENVPIDVTTFGDGYLSAWMDLNIDGDFADAGEQLLTDVFINSTTVEQTGLVLPVPYTATGGDTYLRFRFSNSTGVSYSGAVTAGEVEDYQITIQPAAPNYNMVKTSNGPITAAGPLTYTFTFENTGNVVLDNLTVTDPDIDAGTLTGCPIASLAVGATQACTATRTISQTQVDAGVSLSNTATPSVEDPIGDPVVEDATTDNTVVTAITQTPSYTMVKSSDTATMSAPGTITYTFTFVNTGNVGLTNLTVTDANIDSGTLTDCPVTTLDVGATATCTATRAITQAQIDSGVAIVNTATSSATGPDGTTAVAEDDTADDNSTTTVALQSPLAVDDAQANLGLPTPTNPTTLTLIGDNDSDPDGTIDAATVDLDPKTVGIDASFTNADGTYAVDAAGNVTFTPSAALTGNPTPITYTVNDNDGLTSNEAMLTVTYGTAPVAVDDTQANPGVPSPTNPTTLALIGTNDSDPDGTIDPATVDLDPTTAGIDSSFTNADGTYVADASGNVTFTPNATLTGNPAPIAYTVNDNDGNTSNEATLTVTYGTAPVAVDDAQANTGVPSPTNPTTLALIGANDSDPDGTIDAATVDLDPTTAGIDASFTNADGTYVADTSGNVTFTPNATLTGNPTPIAYTVNDNDGNTSNEAMLTVTYGTAPVAVDDAEANTGVPSPTNPTTLALIGTNDSDPDGTINAATVDLDPTTTGIDSSFTNADGTYVADASGNVTFTPNATLTGNPTPIAYTVNDNDGNTSNEAMLTVTYGTAPVAVDDAEANTGVPSPTNPTMLALIGANDSDADGTIDPATVDLDPTTAGIDSSFTNADGTYVANASGNVTFTPNATLTGNPTQIAYTVNDNDGNTSNEATLTVTYGTAPVAVDDAQANLGVPSPANPTTLALIGTNDSDADGTIDAATVDLDPTTAGIDSSFTNADGTYVTDATGNVTFTPNAALTGNPTPIAYTVNDNDGNTSNEAMLTVTYGTAPVAVDDTQANPGVPSVTNPTTLALIGANDSDSDGTIDATTVDLDPTTAGIDASFTNADGTYVADGAGNVTFTPNATLTGNPMPIAYTVNDNDGNTSNEATLTVTYGTAPVAVDDAQANLGVPSSTNPTTLATIGTNDSDPDGTIDAATVDLDPTTAGIDSSFTNADGTYVADASGNVTFTPNATLTGNPTPIAYTVNDNDGNTSNEATLTVTYGTAPVAVDDAQANLGVPSPTNPTTLALIGANDSDPDGTIDAATVDLDPTTAGVDSSFTNADGTYVADASGNVTFTPSAALTGNPTPIAYTVNDNDGNTSNEAMLTVTYGTAPVAVDDAEANTGVPSPTNPTMLALIGANDSDPDGTIDAATVDLDPTTAGIDASFTNADGTYVADGAGNVTFTPSATLTGNPTPIAYTVNDNDGNTSNEATLTVTYGTAPVAVDDAEANTGVPSPTNPTTLALIGTNDSDPDGTIDAATVDLNPTTAGIDASFTNADGTYVADASGNVTFTPSAALTGNPTPIAYTVNDNDGNTSNEATLTITYGSAPVAVDDMATNSGAPSPSNPTTVATIAANDSDADGTIEPASVDLDPTTAGVDSSFTNTDGTYTADGVGNVTFTPNVSLLGSPAPITYTVNDNDGNTSNEATLTIGYGNDPVAMDDTFANPGVPSPTNLTTLALIGTNDSDPDGTIDPATVDLDPTTAGIDSSFTNADGTYVADASGNITFTPSATLTGNPTPIAYTVNDNDGNTSNEAMLTITYGTAPVAVDDTQANPGVPSPANPTTLALIGTNDSDSDGTIDPATVDLDPATSGIDTSFTNADGTYAADGAGNVTFTPNATLTGNPTPITYTVNDNDGNTSNEATLTVTYGTAPVAVDDTQANPGVPLPVNPTTLALIGTNDSDPDGTIDPATVDLDPMTAGIDASFTNADGTYAVDATGNVTFTPSTALTANPSPITYTVNDNDGNTSNEAMLTITYGTAPVAVDDTQANPGVPSATNPTTLMIVSSNDSDPDGTIDPSTVDLDPTTPWVDTTLINADGTYNVDASGNVTFTPNATLTGNPAPITYTVNDNDGNTSNEATLTVTYGTAPVALDDLATNPGAPSPSNPTTLATIGTNDSDVDGTIDPASVDLDPTTPGIDSTFTNADGNYAVDGAGNVTFTPNASLTGSPTPITYTVNDNDGNTSNEATLTIGYGNDPVAMDDIATNLGTPSPSNPTTLATIGTNDSDPDGTIDPATVDLDPTTADIDALFTNADGTYAVDAAGNVTFTPSATLAGNPSPIAYTVNDNDGNTSNEATLTITYGTAPVAVDDMATNPGTPSPFNPTTLATIGANDSDPDGTIDAATVDLDPTTAGIDSSFTNADGTYTADGAGNVTFTPDASLTGSPTPITYTVNDNDGNTSNEATLTIGYGNDPVAMDDTAANLGVPSSSNPTVLAMIATNDSDPDGTIDPATVDLEPTTAGIDSTFTNADGTYVVDASGNVMFTPNATLTGNPTPITYTVNDNDGNTSNEAMLTVTYGTAPVAVDDMATNPGTPSPSNPTTLALIGTNDSDPDGTIDVATVDLDPTTDGIDSSFINADGTYVADASGNVTFTPNATLTGNPTPIAYTVNDNDGNTSNEAMLMVTYGTAPVAVDDMATNPGTPSPSNPITLATIGANDSDPDGTIDAATVDLDPTTLGVDSTFTNADGTYTADTLGNVTFTPNATLTGSPTPITYTVNDNDGNTSNEATLTIGYGNDPVAMDDTATNLGVPSPSNPTTLATIGTNDSDPDGTIDPATVDLDPTTAGIDVLFTNADGTYAVDAAGNVTFTPSATLAGNPSPIAYTVNDNDGNTSNEAMITITYGTAPVAVDDMATNPGTPSPSNPTTLATIGANDSDADGMIDSTTVDLDPATPGIDSTFTNADGTYAADVSGNVTFTPNATLTGSPAPITYTVNDNDGNTSNEATLTIGYGNDPVAMNDSATNTGISSPTNPTTLALIGTNDSDSDGTIDPATVDLDPTTAVIDTSFTNADGTYAVDAAGNVTFTPNATLTGNPSPITYTVNDNDGNTSNEAALTVTYGTAPVAVDDTQANPGVPSPTNPTTLALIGTNDSDPDGTIDPATVDLDPTTAGIDSSFTNADGTYAVDAAGNVTFTPNATLTGNPSPITYTVNDNDGNTSNEATLTITYGTAPVAVDDTQENPGVPSPTNPTTLATIGTNDSDPDGTIDPATVDLDPMTAGIDASFTNADGTYAVDAAGNVTFTPSATLTANPSPITYTVNDNDGNTSNEAMLTITYGTAPVAVDDTQANPGVPSAMNPTTLMIVSSNDSDPDGTIDPSTVDLDPTTPWVDTTLINADGTYNADASGNVTFTPNATLTGNPAPIAYTVNDNDGNTSNEATLTVTYGAAPVAIDDLATNPGAPSPSNPTTLATIGTNDSDVDGTIDPVSVDLDPTTPGIDSTFTNADGTYVADASGNITFTPNAALIGSPTPITYTVNDNDGNTSNEATLTIGYGNDPVAMDDTAANLGVPSPSNPTTLATIGTNDSDPDGTIDPATVDLDPKTAGIDSTFTNADGTYVVDASGNVTFTPNAALTGNPTPITYTVNDNDGNTSNEATLTITYGIAPVAVDDMATNPGTPSPSNPTTVATIGTNDSDPDGTIDPTTVDLDPATPGIDSTFTNADGIYSTDASGNVTFTPNATLTGSPAPITYTVNDNDGNTSNEATLTIGYGNDPVAMNDNATNTGIPSPTNPTTLALIGTNDSDSDGTIDPATVDLDPTTAAIDSSFTNADGTYAVDAAGNVTFTPNATLTGNPSPITYTVNDNDGNTSNEATLTIGYGNNPVATDDTAVNLGTPAPSNPTVLATVGTNDSDVDGTINLSTLDLNPTTPGIDSSFTNADGTYTADALGNVTFTPNATLTGNPSPITYTVNDNDGNTSNEATLTVTYGTAPVAVDDVQENPNVPSSTNPTVFALVASNDSDPDGTINLATIDLNPATQGVDSSFTNADGTYTADASGNVTFTPNATLAGSPSPITYTVNDNDGNTSNEATLTVTYGTAPIAIDDVEANTGVPSPANPTTLLAVVGNDLDFDGTIDPATVDLDPTTAGIDSSFTNVDGTYTVDTSGNVTFTPSATLAGNPSSITYTVNDNDGNTSGTATLTVTYASPEVTPSDNAGSSVSGTPATPIANVTAGDTINGQPVQLGTGGNATIAPSGEWPAGIWPAGITLDPATGAVSTDATVQPGVYKMDYDLCDLSTPAVCETATVTITVAGEIIPDADSGTALSGTPATPIANITEGDSVNGQPVQLGADGNATIAPSGEWPAGIWPAGITLDPATGAVSTDATVQAGTYEMEYELCDLSTPANCEVAMVTIVVEGNAAPIAQDDSSAPNQPLGQSVTVDTLANDSDPENKLDPTSVKIVDPSGEPVTTLVVAGEGTWVVNPTTGAITFTPEAGFTNDPTAITYTVSDQAGNTSNAATVSIDYEEAAAITGVVWVDANQNGLVDAGEERKAGWTLKIKDADGNVVATTVTDADGNYSITGLIPAVYTVEFYDAEGTFISSQRTNGSLVAGQSMTVPLPLEPVVNANPDLDDNSILLSKSVNKQQISVGDQLYYTIRAENLTEDEIVFDINDNLPTGFKLASTNVKLTHAGADGTFGTDDDTYPAITTTGIDPVRFKAITLGQSEKAQVGYLVKVGTAAPQGSSVNTAQAFAAGSMTDIASNIATASVETIADTVIDQATLIGKVFHDRDGDGYQDSANVTGLTIKSDYFGWNGLNIGELQGRASVLGNPAKFRKVVRMPWSIKNDFEVTTEQGTVVSIDEDGQVRESHTGDKANGLTAQSIQVTTRLTEGVPTPTSIVAMRQPTQVMNVIEITIMNHGIQEEGLPGVRLATVKGLVIETDAYGRYNIPDVNSGSRSMGQNFIIKVDSATLPQGARFTTENPRVLRLTGTALEKINFGVKLAPQRLDQTAEANLKSSFFDAGRDSIKARNLGAMDNIARSIKQYGQGRIIIGLSRQSGLNTEARLDLAKRRAYSVQTYLLERLGHQLMTRVRVEVSTQ